MYIDYINDFFMIAVGISLLSCGTATVIKINKGSKITFAYAMAGFSCLYGG